MKFVRRTSKNIQENFLKELLIDRKIIDAEDNAEFFFPTIANEEDFNSLDHVREGCELLKKHIDNNNIIYLPVDPDADGYTSASLFYNYLVEVLNYPKEQIIYHIPEGKEHGLSTIMNWFPSDGSNKLIVAIDSSSNDYEEHQELSNQGYDILVVDHHEADKYSENAIVINNQLSVNYDNKMASGVGVIYKFFECWESMYGGQSAQNYLDLVALGEISDVMQMTTLENRYICDYGLSHLNNKFFKELVAKQAFSLGNKPLSQIGVAFYITPLINALIRVGNPLEKERLFLAFISPDTQVPSTKRGEKGLIETICTQSIRNCVNAKARQTKERDKAAELLDIQILEQGLDENKILILNADELDTPNTLTGLCAMEIAAKYKRPVLLGRRTPDGKEMKGSIRNFDGSPLLNLKEFLKESNLMTYVEGHPNAAGWGSLCTNLDRLVEYANRELADVNFNEGFHEVDFIVPANCSYLSNLIFDLDNGRLYWGQGNPEAKIAVENISIDTANIQIVGQKNKDTVRFSFNGITYIKFKAKKLIEELSMYQGKINMTVVGMPLINTWNGIETPQIKIEEVEIKENSVYDF